MSYVQRVCMIVLGKGFEGVVKCTGFYCLISVSVTEISSVTIGATMTSITETISVATMGVTSVINWGSVHNRFGDQGSGLGDHWDWHLKEYIKVKVKSF